MPRVHLRAQQLRRLHVRLVAHLWARVYVEAHVVAVDGRRAFAQLAHQLHLAERAVRAQR